MSLWFVEVVDTRATAQEGEEFLVDVCGLEGHFSQAYFYVYFLNFYLKYKIVCRYFSETYRIVSFDLFKRKFLELARGFT